MTRLRSPVTIGEPAGTPSGKPRGRAEWIVTAGLAALLFLAPLAIGGVHDWSSALLQIAASLLAAGWAVARPRDGSTPIAFVVAAGALCGYMALLTLPVPRGVIARTSPATEEIYRRTIDSIDGIAPPIEGPSGEAGRGGALTAEHARIVELAAPSRSWLPVEWRPIALYPYAARADVRRYLTYGLILWLAATLPFPRLLLGSIAVSGIFVALLALVQYVTWNGKILWTFVPYDTGLLEAQPRITGPFVNPSHFATSLAMALPAGAALLRSGWRRTVRSAGAARAPALAALGVGLAVMIAALLGTASRGGIVGALLGAAVLWWGFSRSARDDGIERGRPRGSAGARAKILRMASDWGPAALVAAIVLGGLLFAGPRALRGLDQRLGDTFTENDLGFRLLLWKQTLPMVADFPFFGVGPRGWQEVFRRYESYPVVGRRPNHAHNDYLEWLAENGVAGLLLTIAAAAAYVAWTRGNDSIPKTLRYGILAAITAVSWQATVDFSLRVPANAIVLAVLLGLLANRCWELDDQENERVYGAAERRCLGRLRGAAVACLALFVVIGSVRQFREFRQWQRARAGIAALAFAPANAETWIETGKSLRQAPAAAMASFRRAALLRPASGRPYFGLSSTSMATGARLRGIEAALFLDPTRFSWRIARAVILDGIGRGAEALRELEEAALRDPRSSSRERYLTPLGPRPSPLVVAALERGLRRALDERPTDSVLLHGIAAFYEGYGEWTKAAGARMRIAETTGDWAAQSLRAAEDCVQARNLRCAETALRRAIEKEPQHPEPYRSLALTVLRPQKRHDEAAETLLGGARKVRDASLLFAALYEVRSDQGDEKGALDALGRAANLKPRDAALQFALGEAHLRAGSYHWAKIALDRAIARDPKNAAFHRARGLALEKMNDLAGARDAYRRAIELSPGDEASRSGLARVEGVLGRR